MVGSGFSRSAEMKAPRGGTPPDWADVARAMHAKLKQISAKAGGSGVDSSALDALSTAQRFSDEFGRVELHRFLRDQIRDDDMEPGGLHRRLLALPWVDVFTTNWDTLLERTRELTISPTYEVVRAVDELPLASRPRIVKLHGSLPAHFPLIATELDYRDYPKEFAPFVNTARQALMETLFLLLGFFGRRSELPSLVGVGPDGARTVSPRKSTWRVGWTSRRALDRHSRKRGWFQSTSLATPSTRSGGSSKWSISLLWSGS